MTPLPDGSGVTTRHARPAGHDLLVVCVELSADVLEHRCQRAAHRRHAADGRPDARRTSSGSGVVGARACRAFRRTRQFPNTLPTFLIGGYQQLGSPPNTATDFSTSVTQIADTLTWLKGRHTLKIGRGSALGAAERDPAAVADRLVHVQQPVHRSAGRTNTGTPFASFLLGQVQQFSIDLQQDADPEPRALPGVLHPGRLARVDRGHGQCRACATR